MENLMWLEDVGTIWLGALLFFRSIQGTGGWIYIFTNDYLYPYTCYLKKKSRAIPQ